MPSATGDGDMGIMSKLLGVPAQRGGDGLPVVHVEKAGGGGVVDDAGAQRRLQKRVVADGLPGLGATTRR